MSDSEKIQDHSLIAQPILRKKCNCGQRAKVVSEKPKAIEAEPPERTEQKNAEVVSDSPSEPFISKTAWSTRMKQFISRKKPKE